MVLMLFNSGTGKKERFRTLKPNEVKVYVCGITPYDTTHLGHAFTYASFDTLIRYLKFKGFKVTYTQNVTDIDDDTLERAKEEGRDWRELGRFWTRIYLRDMKSLNVARPDHYVKATEAIPKAIEMISALLKRGYAYKSGGNVYFEVARFPRYGGLSHFTRKQMAILLKERGGDPGDPNKKNPLDFILWQKFRRGEPHWEAPFGKGRPGWHIECSAMINKYLGDQIDVHGGGRDLIYPHHESEIAQSESFTGKRPFARYFMHTGAVMYMGEKMSKSLGNLVMVSDLLTGHSPNAVRWLLLSHHYREAWEYMPEELEEADLYAGRISKMMSGGNETRAGSVNRSAVSEFESAMNDDMNTPKALGVVKALIDMGEETTTARCLSGVLGFAGTRR